MVLGKDIHTEDDILSQQRQAVEPLLKYHLNGCYTNLDLNIPIVYGYIALAIVILAILIAVPIIVACLVGKSYMKHSQQYDFIG